MSDESQREVSTGLPDVDDAAAHPVLAA